jgi:hypothetical protein
MVDMFYWAMNMMLKADIMVDLYSVVYKHWFAVGLKKKLWDPQLLG